MSSRKSLLVALIFVVPFFFVPQSRASRGISELYVSPVGTGNSCSAELPCALNDARSKQRSLLKDGHGVIVNLLAGKYSLGSTFVLSEEDSGFPDAPTIYRSTSGGRVVLSGGLAVPKWRLEDKEKKIFSASVPLKRRRFRQMYVDGERADLAGFPNLDRNGLEGLYLRSITSSPFLVKAADLPTSGIAPASEIIWLSHWRQRRLRVLKSEPDKQGIRVTFDGPGADAIDNGGGKDEGVFFRLENAKEYLDSCNEWFMEETRGELFYKSCEDFDVRHSKVVAPVTETLIKIEGRESNNVHDIIIDGVEFDVTNWIDPSDFGYITQQAGVALSSKQNSLVPGMVSIRNARNITIKRSKFRNSGANAISASGKLVRIGILGNKFRHLSSGAYVEFSDGISDGTKIVGNYISGFGEVYTDAVAIFLKMPRNALVCGNEISDGNYSGISMGWTWDDRDVGLYNNRIAYNKIGDVMKLHDDGGAVYSLGKMDLIIEKNYIYNIERSFYAGEYDISGIYLDNGSVQRSVYKNVLDIRAEAFSAKNMPNRNNDIYENYVRSALGRIASENMVRDNIPLGRGEIKGSALVIQRGAGLIAAKKGNCE